MSTTKIRYSKRVKLQAEAPGYPDGRLVVFEVWKKTSRGEEIVTAVNGITKGGKAYANWNPNFNERAIALKANAGEIKEQVEEEKYYFIAKIDEKEAKSGEYEFTFPLDVYLEDEYGKPLSDVDFTITFSDGSKKTGKLKDGHAKVEDAPSGRFEIEIEGYVMK